MFNIFKKKVLNKTFDITFTIHAIKRISERFQDDRTINMEYLILNQYVPYRHNGKFIDPKLMNQIIEDAKNIREFKYCRRDDTIISIGTIGIYVYDRGGKVVTVMTALTDEYTKKHYIVDVSEDFLIKFMTSIRDSKPFNPEYW